MDSQASQRDAIPPREELERLLELHRAEGAELRRLWRSRIALDRLSAIEAEEGHLQRLRYSKGGN